MTLSTLDYIVLAGILLILVPVLITPAGWLFAAIVVAIWLIATYGGRYFLELHKWKSEGERGRVSNVRRRARNRRED